MLFFKPNKPHLFTLYAISFFIVALFHLLLLLNISPFLQKSGFENIGKLEEAEDDQKQFKVRILGYENAKSLQGDLRQLKTPDRIYKGDTPQKSLQKNKRLKINQNIARILPPKSASPPKKVKTVKQEEKKENKKDKQLQKFDLSRLGQINRYQPLEKSEPRITYQAASIGQYVEQARIFESLSGKLANLDLRNISSSVQIEIPKGNIKEDELNSAERRFYSFKRRVFQAYVQSLLTQAYNQQGRSTPFPFTSKSTSTSAKVTYDEKGNLVRIKILKPTRNIKLQNVFISALQDIQTIPNPPREIINGFGEFSQVYVLNITF